MYRSHVLVCGGTGCTSSGSEMVIKALEKELAANNLTDEVKIVKTGCFGPVSYTHLLLSHRFSRFVKAAM